MEKQTLATTSIEELKKNHKLLGTITAAFFGLLLLLIIVNLFLYINKWLTASAIVPRALLPIALIIAMVNLKKLKDIQAEIKTRETISM